MAKNLETYSSFRKYLLDQYLQEKSQSKGVSIAKFAKFCGLGSSLFKMVVNGSRDLTIHNIHKIAQAFKMTETEIRYFESLVLYEQSKEPFEKAYYLSRLNDTRTRHSLPRIRSSKSSLIKIWYYPALMIYIVDVLNIKNGDFSSIDCSKIAKKLELSSEEVKKACEEILSSLSPNEVRDSHLIYSKVSNPLADKHYLQSIFREAQKRLDLKYQSPQNYFSASVFSISENEIEEFFQAYKSVVEKYVLASETAKSQKVVQVAFQMFEVF